MKKKILSFIDDNTFEINGKVFSIQFLREEFIIKNRSIEELANILCISHSLCKKLLSHYRGLSLETKSASQIKSLSERAMERKYGAKCASQVEEFKQKMQSTCEDRYGKKHPAQNDRVKEKKKTLVLKDMGV